MNVGNNRKTWQFKEDHYYNCSLNSWYDSRTFFFYFFLVSTVNPHTHIFFFFFFFFFNFFFIFFYIYIFVYLFFHLGLLTNTFPFFIHKQINIIMNATYTASTATPDTIIDTMALLSFNHVNF
jgi:hypothetical protein